MNTPLQGSEAQGAVPKGSAPSFVGRLTLTQPDRIARLDAALALVRAEVLRAISKFPPFNSPHEGYGVLLEEVDELWDEVKADQPERAVEEAVQVAAMGVRFMMDVRGLS